MYIKNLKLMKFRNYDDIHLNFNKRINLLIGKNGQGKTNILEGIYMLSFGKSFRTNKDKELIQFEKENTYIGGVFEKKEKMHMIELVIGKDSKKGVKINKISIEKIAQLLGNFNAVIFSPEDLKLVKEGPKERRKFIDREISQIVPKYYHYISNYNKILFQRNKLLKTYPINENLVDVFDHELSKNGCYIYLYRKKFIDKIRILASTIHKNLTDDVEDLNIEYANQIHVTNKDTCLEVQEKFLEALKKNRSVDMQSGNTKVGPHKDDIDIFVNGLDAKIYSSQGQQRTASISLKLSEIELIKEETGEDPVVLLDDIFSELDEKRQLLLVNHLNHLQIFITSAEEGHKEIFENKDISIFHVEKGRVFTI